MSSPPAPWWRRPVLVAVVLGVLGFTYRLVMTLAQVPEPNSDEATMAIAALKISEGLERPIWFYDQFYMGTLEAYVAAPLIHFFGTTMFMIRLPLLACYVLFLVVMWLLARHLYTPWLATVTVALLALGSEKILHNQLVAQGGYPEMNPAGALLILIPVLIGLKVVRGRTLWYGIWGFTTGLMVWVDWLVAPYIVLAAILLLIVTWWDGLRGLRLAWVTLVTAVTGALGGLPFLYYNLKLKWPGYDSLHVFLQLQKANGNASLSERLYGGGIVGIPMGTGMCVPGHCTSWQLWWSAGYLLLILASGAMAVIALRRAGSRPDKVRELGRLILVLGAVLTIISYVRTPSAGWWYNETARYLSCLIISTPAVLWPLWSAATSASRAWARNAAKVSVATIVAMAAFATAAVFANFSTLKLIGQRQDGLVAALESHGISRIYSEFWTCNVVSYKSHEKVICAVLDGELNLGRNRYAPYIQVVAAEPRPAYVVPHQPYDGGGRSEAVDKRLKQLGMTSEMFTIDGYDIYLPSAEFTAQLPARKPAPSS